MAGRTTRFYRFSCGGVDPWDDEILQLVRLGVLPQLEMEKAFLPLR